MTNTSVFTIAQAAALHPKLDHEIFRYELQDWKDEVLSIIVSTAHSKRIDDHHRRFRLIQNGSFKQDAAERMVRIGCEIYGLA